MNVWIIQTGERVPLSPEIKTMRSGLLAKECASRGHNVLWWTSSFDHITKQWINQDDNPDDIVLEPGLSIIPLKGIGYSKNISARRFLDHAIIARRFAKLAEGRPKPDIVVAALPDYRLAYAAYKYAKKHKIKFVLDLRDRWPWDFTGLVPKSAGKLLRLLLSNDFRMASKLIKDADIVTTMMESWVDWIEKEIGRPKSKSVKVYYLGAAGKVDIEPNKLSAATQKVLSQVKDRWVVLFIGSFTSRSWPKIALEIANHPDWASVGKDRPVFVLAGDGDYMAELKRKVTDEMEIYLPGFVNETEISALLGVSRVGLVTSNGDFEAVPNKVFTYMSGGLPMISTIKGELVALLDDNQIGMNCTHTEEAMAAILRFKQEPELTAQYSQNSLEIFNEKYEAKSLYKKFADYILK